MKINQAIPIFTLLFAIAGSLPCQAQLSHTRWVGTLRTENPINVIFDFGMDTFSVYTVADSTVLEKMQYGLKDTVLTIKKIDGQSDCDNATTGKYAYQISKGSLFLRLLEDDCHDRSSVLDTSRWRKWEDHKEVVVDPAVLQRYVGVYQFDPAHQLIVTLENGKLQIEGPNNNLPKVPLTALSQTRFFIQIAGVEIDFVVDTKGNVTDLISHEAQDYDLKKVK